MQNFLRKIIYVLLLGIAPNLMGQTSDSNKETIDEAIRLMSEEQYASAFILLSKADPENKDLDIFKKKYQIAMKYNVSVVEYNLFGLKDFSVFDSDDTLDITKKNQQLVVFNFPIYQILDTLLAADSSNLEVHELIVDYFYTVWENTKGKWILPESQLLDKLQFHYKYLIKNGISPPLYNYMTGYVYFLDGEMDSTIKYMKKALFANPRYGDANYTLGVAYYYLRDFQKSLYHGELASRYYHENHSKADAFRLMGLSFWQLGDKESAYDAYLICDKLHRKNRATLKLLLQSMVALNDDDRLLRINEFFNIDPSDPQIYYSLNEIYTSQGKENELLEFYNLRFESHKGDHQVLGNLYYFKGLLLTKKDKMTALQDFTEANRHFSEVYKDNHPIFAMIQKSIQKVQL